MKTVDFSETTASSDLKVAQGREHTKIQTGFSQKFLRRSTPIFYESFLSFFLTILSRSSFDHHLRCVGRLNLEFSKREKHSEWNRNVNYLQEAEQRHA